MIVGTGIDIVETDRVRALMEKHGERFILRWFDDEEIAYCKDRIDAAVHFASRMAAKEAAFKTLRISGSEPLCWKAIIVAKDEDGAPRLVLTGTANAAAARLGITDLHLSLSHCGKYAIAMVTAERLEPDSGIRH